MNFHWFCCYSALLFAFGLYEVASVIPHNVYSITRGRSSTGRGCLVYFPFPDHSYFEFFPNTEERYEDIRTALLQAGDDRNALRQIINEVKNSRLTSAGSSGNQREYVYFYPNQITSITYTDLSNSIGFTYEGKKVVIIFSDNAGLKAMLAVLDQNRPELTD